MKGLEHPNIVRALDEPAEYNGFHYFVIEYLPGGDLAQAVIEGTIDSLQALRAIVAVGGALQHAHERRLIRRDVKPQNILLDGLGAARLTDFDLVWTALTYELPATGEVVMGRSPEVALQLGDFGHERGAFSGAVTTKVGLLETPTAARSFSTSLASFPW